RPNVVVSGAAPWAEGEWVGRRLRIGGAVVGGGHECGRCLGSPIDPGNGGRGGGPPPGLAPRRDTGPKVPFGLQMTVRAEPGGPSRDDRTISVGDTVEVLD